jgi:tripartite ATP-independent transporter DctM subunit
MPVTETYGWMTNLTITAVPLYIFMGILLERSGIAEDLFEMMYRWAGSLKGGLAIGVVIICTIFAAMTGVTAASTITMGLIALPAMLNRNYDKHIAIGSIASSGTLAILIPPSVMMVILGMISQISVGSLYAAGVFSGFFLSLLLMGYIIIRAHLQPQLCPAIQIRYTFRQKIKSLKAVILPMFLIFAVVGTIFAGIATPTEAAAVGALGTLICVFIYKRFTWQLLKNACYTTFKVSSMVSWIIIGSTTFIRVYTAIGAPKLIQDAVAGWELNRWLIIIIMMIILFFLGMFLDPGGVIMLAAPIFTPIVLLLDFDLTWFGVLFMLNLQMGYLSPPFGMNLFYMRSIAPQGITMKDIYHAILPFLGIMILGMIVIMVFPQIALWFPSIMGK